MNSFWTKEMLERFEFIKASFAIENIFFTKEEERMILSAVSEQDLLHRTKEFLSKQGGRYAIH